MHLQTGEYEPYRKDGPPPMYVHHDSNHPPAIVRNLPSMIEKRISGLCSSQEMFDKHAPFYNEALRKAGYKRDIKYIKQAEQLHPGKRRSRLREIIWYNPPYNKAVLTNIGKKFLLLVDKHFGKGSKWYNIFNGHTVKVSYCCTRNMASHIYGQNQKLLREIRGEQQDAQPCPSIKRGEEPCEVIGKYKDKCGTKDVVYQAIVASGNKTWNYIGMTSRSFHKRWLEHKNDMSKDTRAGTALSAKVRELREAGKPINIQTEIIRVAHTYKTGDSQCDLCLTEKTCIALHSMAPRKLMTLPAGCQPLNIRTEIMNGCPHKIEYRLIGRKKPASNHT